MTIQLRFIRVFALVLALGALATALVGFSGGAQAHPAGSKLGSYEGSLGSSSYDAAGAPLNTPTPGSCGASEPQPWRTAVPEPDIRFKAGGTSDGEHVYIIGGNGSTYTNNVRLADVWKWQPDTDGWTRLANLPTAKMSVQGSHWDGKLYVPGGYTGANQYTSELSIYDIGTNSWSVGAPMPLARAGVATAAYNGRIYAFGGQSATGMFTTTVSIYNIATNSWSNAAPMPRPMSYGRAVTFGNDIYHIGGIDWTAGAFGVASHLVYRYDPNANAWDAMASLRRARANHEVMTDGTRIYAVNGATGVDYHVGLPQAESLEIYDVSSNTWTYGYPTVRTASGSAGGFARGKLMIQGGINGNSTYNTVQVSQVALGPCATPGTPVTRTPTPTRTSTRTPITPVSTFTRTPLPTPGPCGGWRHFPAPNGRSNGDFLRDVDAFSANDVWAVGDQGPAGTYESLIQHWDGQSWMNVTSPISLTLQGVVAIAPNDAWAVGFNDSYGSTRTLHWDGTSWTLVPSPDVPGHPNYLYAVDASGPNDVWAVGLANSRSLTMHWDGTAWTIVPVPAPSGYALYDVSVLAPNDVWAVGKSGSSTYAIHWNGITWTHVPTPNPGTYANELEGVVAISANDVWAVGSLANGPVDYHGLLLHWDGTEWEHFPAPEFRGERAAGGERPDTYGIHLHDVAAASSNEVWAVGRDYISSDTMSVILRWDGNSWSESPHPDPSRSINRLYGVTAVGPGEAWAVGTYWQDGGSAYRALIERYGPACGSPTSTATTGGPTSTRTATQVAATQTATALVTGTITVVPSAGTATSTGTPIVASPTATACGNLTITGALTLDDPTQAGRLNTLTEASTCADPRGCPGVIDVVPRHYDAYTFVNNSNSEACFTVDLTAACLDEILIHSAAYLGSFDPNDLCDNYLADVGPGVLTNSEYSFTVPAGAQFVVVVNELAPNLLCPSYTLEISGPACRVPTTPVPTSTSIIPTLTVIPTLSVIPTVETCQITFSDVEEESPFYEQIMCLSCMGMMGGYGDGTFRPNQTVTRGQLAKIVSNTAGFTRAGQQRPSVQSFEDVLEGSTFHMYIEEMTSRGIIAGYSCGGPGEPCGPENRPYFRPGASATRGQISKIVSNAAGLTDTPTEQSFEDVPSTHTFYVWIERLVMHGMMSGYACGGVGEPCGPANRPYFRPEMNATRGQTSKIVGNGFYPGCEPRH